MTGTCEFFIIGAAKSGTTSLHARLQSHPDLFLAEPKEPEFFARDELFAKGFSDYEALFDGKTNGQLCGEASTLYSLTQCFPNTPERIKAYRPDAKFIFMMREPVGRAYAFYQQILKNYQGSTQDFGVHRSFEDCLARDRLSIAPREKFFAEFDSHFPDTPTTFTGGSDYLEQISAYEAHFPKENFLFLLFEDFIHNQDAVCAQVLSFLNVDPAKMPELPETSVNRSESHVAAMASQSKVNHLQQKLGPLYGLKTLVPSGVRNWVKDSILSKSPKSSPAVGAPPPMRPATRERLSNEFYAQFSTLQQHTGLDMQNAWGEAVPSEFRKAEE